MQRKVVTCDKCHKEIHEDTETLMGVTLTIQGSEYTTNWIIPIEIKKDLCLKCWAELRPHIQKED